MDCLWFECIIIYCISFFNFKYSVWLSRCAIIQKSQTGEEKKWSACMSYLFYFYVKVGYTSIHLYVLRQWFDNWLTWDRKFSGATRKILGLSRRNQSVDTHTMHTLFSKVERKQTINKIHNSEGKKIKMIPYSFPIAFFNKYKLSALNT